MLLYIAVHYEQYGTCSFRLPYLRDIKEYYRERRKSRKDHKIKGQLKMRISFKKRNRWEDLITSFGPFFGPLQGVCMHACVCVCVCVCKCVCTCVCVFLCAYVHTYVCLWRIYVVLIVP